MVLLTQASERNQRSTRCAASRVTESRRSVSIHAPTRGRFDNSKESQAGLGVFIGIVYIRFLAREVCFRRLEHVFQFVCAAVIPKLGVNRRSEERRHRK